MAKGLDLPTDHQIVARPSGLKVNECPLLPSLDHALLGAFDVVDCGALPRAAMSSMLKAAQRCVLDAQNARRAFRVSYRPASYDSEESAGVASRGGHSPVVYLQRTSTPVAPWTMRASLRVNGCGELRVRENCAFEQGDLCLDCAHSRPLADACEKLETF